jgi:hypothetical protein
VPVGAAGSGWGAGFFVAAGSGLRRAGAFAAGSGLGRDVAAGEGWRTAGDRPATIVPPRAGAGVAVPDAAAPVSGRLAVTAGAGCW